MDEEAYTGEAEPPVPSPTEDTVEQEQEPEPEVEMCAACGAEEGTCDCVTCPSCDRRVGAVCPSCEECESRCCNCVTCQNPRCGERVESVCDACDRCTNCCHCYTCRSCDATVTSVCGNDRCEDCCEDACDHDDDDGDGLPLVSGKNRFHDGKKGGKGPARYVSAEIEVAGTQDDCVSRVVRKWGAAIVEDGSLPSGGRELNTAPARRDAWRAQIREICVGLKQSRARVDESCGLHVHVDARDYSYYEIRRLIKLYVRLEPALFAIIAPSRLGSSMCHPCGEKFEQVLQARGKMSKPQWFRAVYGMPPDRCVNKQRLRREKYNNARYYALNLHSWVYRGTVECRMHHGTTDETKIRMWGELWSKILEFAAKQPEKVVDELPMWDDFDGAGKRMVMSYRVLRNEVCADDPDLQGYLDERAKHFGRIPMEEV